MTAGDQSGNEAPPIILDRSFYREPRAVYKEIRESGGKPVRVVVRDGMAYIPRDSEAFLITDRNQIRDLASSGAVAKKSPGTSSVDFIKTVSDSSVPNIYANMANVDPPDHTKYRRAAAPYFTPRASRDWEPELAHIANRIYRPVVAESSWFDLVSAFAFPFAIAAICKILGISDSDSDRFAPWADTITRTGTTVEIHQAVEAMTSYLTDVVNKHVTADTNSLLAAMGKSLGISDSVAQAYALLVAGYETTANAISSAFYMIDSDPHLRASIWDKRRFKEHVDELLLAVSPFAISLFRIAQTDLNVAGVDIPEGALVFYAFDAANAELLESSKEQCRGRQLDEADRSVQNEALTFGHGIHNCIGQHLARLELSVALQTMRDLTPDVHVLGSQELSYRVSPTFRGLDELYLTYS